ncbi:molybdopterin molybdotransferase MoeA [Anianabacter salinae]|uniref:molybdopterin molybdotransferase MoeA n=1 Tax=Anianabacter salinae TaxID=2851023 RepID=UPI00225DDDFD|nr:gephyrin-like molybdotransferase Glp [Anianabacter salinae]MBV0911559.1 molybdopterin molybdotransferase MoeA [Anianabacter salinae]
MISVAEALARVLALGAPLPPEDVPLRAAHGRILAAPLTARRAQPPFPASAMDGYAARRADAVNGAKLTVIGEAAAGDRFAGTVGPGQTVRIFTGAPVPEGADHIILQEDVARDVDTITLGDRLEPADHIRPAGADFAIGYTLDAPRRLGSADLALIAAMNHGIVPVTRKPDIAIIATGDELVMPGEDPGPDQIVASNIFALAAMVEDEGAEARILPIARDNANSLRLAFELAAGADLIVTVGGASVGDHDLVGKVAGDLGLDRAFYKIAMRPGKPLMAGRLSGSAMLGLPGNPVSAIVCGHLFLLPLVRRMLGLPDGAAPRIRAPLAVDVAANGPREHYVRARLEGGAIHPFERQDSSLLTVLTEAHGLLVRPVDDPARKAGDIMEYVPLTQR